MSPNLLLARPRAALHLAGRHRPQVRYRAREATAFQGGLLLMLLALISPLGYRAGQDICVRSIQDLLLAFAAPALIILGAPWKVSASGRPGRSRTHDPMTTRRLAWLV